MTESRTVPVAGTDTETDTDDESAEIPEELRDATPYDTDTAGGCG